MRVIYSLTPNLYPYLLPSIMSLLEYNDVDKIYILALDDSLPYELPECCDVIKVNPSDYIREDSPNWKCVWTPMCLVRVATSKIIPDDKVLQLDVDTIICDSLEPIWNVDITERYCAMVKETAGSYRPYGDDYFNFGVCLFNLKKIREDKIDDEWIGFINTTETLCVDQDAVNRTGNIIELPDRFNEMFATSQSPNPAIVHFAGYGDWWLPTFTPRFEYYAKWKHFERPPLNQNKA